jgi:hypothetical protein
MAEDVYTRRRVGGQARECADCRIPLRPMETLRCRKCRAWRDHQHYIRLAAEAMRIATS